MAICKLSTNFSCCLAGNNYAPLVHRDCTSLSVHCRISFSHSLPCVCIHIYVCVCEYLCVHACVWYCKCECMYLCVCVPEMPVPAHRVRRWQSTVLQHCPHQYPPYCQGGLLCIKHKKQLHKRKKKISPRYTLARETVRWFTNPFLVEIPVSQR